MRLSLSCVDSSRGAEPFEMKVPIHAEVRRLPKRQATPLLQSCGARAVAARTRGEVVSPMTI